MQDGKALQAGTSHYLGQNFSKAQNIRYQDKEGEFQFAHTTSWGASTRLIGGVIMTHGDDDGLRVPPLIAPQQIVIIPMLRDKPEDAPILEYCDALAKQLRAHSSFGEKLRVLVDKKGAKAQNKRWSWVRKGAPLLLEIGGRDVEGGNISLIDRSALYNENGKIAFQSMPQQEFIDSAASRLEAIQEALYSEAKTRLDDNIHRHIIDFSGLEEFFDKKNINPGWLEVQWSKPSGEALDKVVERLKKLKLTIRNAPQNAAAADGDCIFSGETAVERILIGRSY